MNEVIFKTLKEKDFILKNYLIKVIVELKLNINDALVLIYFMNQETPVLNIDLMKTSLCLTDEEIMESYTKLLSINLISVSIIKNEKGVREEVINLDNIINYVTDDKVKKTKKQEEDNLFNKFESEFGRPLSPMEYEIINDWLDHGMDESLINAALKEAIYNGAKSFRYISKILLSWKEKGYKTDKDVNKSMKEDNNSNVELFDYNWLEDE